MNLPNRSVDGVEVLAFDPANDEVYVLIDHQVYVAEMEAVVHRLTTATEVADYVKANAVRILREEFSEANPPLSKRRRPR